MEPKPPQGTLQKQHDERTYSLDDIIRILSEFQNELNRCLGDMPKAGKDVSSGPGPDEDHPSQGHSETKRASRWSRVCAKLRAVVRIKNAASRSCESGGSQSGRGETQASSDENHTMQKLCSDIVQMKKAVEDLSGLENHIGKELEIILHVEQLKGKLEKVKSGSMPTEITDYLKEISKKILNLRCKMPLMRYKRPSGGLGIKDYHNAPGNDKIDEDGDDLYLPGLQIDKDFVSSPAFIDVKEKFMGLEITRKLCLLSFAVFPENSEVKKTMLMYWWIGEGLLCTGKNGEKLVDDILVDFSRKELIEPVEDDRKLEPNSYKMEPQVHSSVTFLADNLGFFKIYDKNNGKPAMAKSDKKKVCLVEGSLLREEAKVKRMKPHDLETVFNASERFPDFTFKWFPEMESLRVLYLGRWERNPQRHIEVENSKLLENLEAMKKIRLEISRMNSKPMKKLRLMSLQGISRIEKLDDSICKLPKLVILDLRACYNLEALPEGIDELKRLIYLDVSECYMLDRMPKKISGLSELEVLKGFVVSDADEESCCTIPELKLLRKLRKLSINVNRDDFKMEFLMTSLEKLKQLESLKVAWGARFSGKESDQGDKKAQTSQDKNGDGRNKEAHLAKSKESNGAEKTGTPQEKPEDKVQAKKEDGKGDNEAQTSQEKKGDGRKEEAGLTESKVRNGAEAKTQKSDEIVEEDKKPSPTAESKATIQKTQKSDEIVEEDKKPNPATEAEATIQRTQKLDEIVEEDKKPSATPESKATIQKKTDDGKGDNDEVKTTAAKPNPRKNRVSYTGESHDATSSTQDKKRITKGTESRGAGKRVPFEKLKRQMTLLPGKKPQAQDETEQSRSKLPSGLKKFELECYPDKEPPGWLSPENLCNLEKLSIKGGNLSGFRDKPRATKNKCNIEVLRLNYLDEFKAEWRDLQEMFPKLRLFEKCKCPKITFCPSDGRGIWRAPPQSQPQQNPPE